MASRRNDLERHVTEFMRRLRNGTAADELSAEARPDRSRRSRARRLAMTIGARRGRQHLHG